MPESFTEEEKKILRPFVSNVDKPVFVLRNLPEVIKGALFSRYSRSQKSLRRLLLDEFIKDKETGFSEMVQHQEKEGIDLKEAVQKAQAFYDRVLDGYGDDSVGELGGAHLACENISNYTSKVLEDARIGGSPLEKSTRYVWFDEKQDGDYLFYKEPVLMASEFKDTYLRINRLLFDTYVKLIDPMKAFVTKHFPLEEFPFFDAAAKKEMPFKEIKDGKVRARAEKGYASAVKAKACDILRHLLPASTLTNVGIFGNGRFFQGLLTKMYSHPVAEIQALAAQIHHELDHLIPSFVRRAKKDGFLVKKRGAIEKIRDEMIPANGIQPAKEVTLVDYDKDEATALAAMLYPYTKLSLLQLRAKIKAMSSEECFRIMQTYLDGRSHRRDKPGRALEHIYYTFDILADFGIYRDLQRHRVLTQERQDLTVIHGYVTPQEIIDAGFNKEYSHAMNEAIQAYREIAEKYPKEAQYVVPMAFRIRWYMKMNLREAFHFIELRSIAQGHPGYRKVAQEMYQEIKRVHPAFAAYMKFVDLNEYPLGRIQAAVRQEEKREELLQNRKK